MEEMQTKDAVRRQMRARRKALTPEERERAANAVCAKLHGGCTIAEAVDPFDGGGAIAVYLASPDEIDLSDLILELLKCKATVVAPRWNGETYELAKVKGLSDANLRRGPMNILEPAEADIVKPSDVEVWIVPGLAFTKDGKRLGYGGGWYDRLLASASWGAHKIGVAHEFQIVDDLPHEPHDVKMDDVVTDNFSDRHLDFTETPDGFRASVTVDSPMMRRALFFLSLLGLCLFPATVWFTLMLVKGATSLPDWAAVVIFISMAVAACASVLGLFHVCGIPEEAEVEVKGDEGVCRRRFLGLFPRRDIRFRWSPWTEACPSEKFSVVEVSAVQNLFKTYADTATLLALRMNLAHHVAPEELEAAAEAVLANLPRGMRIVREGESETMEVAVHSLAGVGSTIGCCLFLGLLGTLIVSFLTRWPVLFFASLVFLWCALILAVLNQALWSLFGTHRLTVTGKECRYEARLGPRVKRRHFTLSGNSQASSCPGGALQVAVDTCSGLWLFQKLPGRCYLPLVLFVRKHANGSVRSRPASRPPDFIHPPPAPGGRPRSGRCQARP